MSHSAPLIALVDDDATHVLLVGLFLESEGFQTVHCFHAHDALDLIHQEQPGLVLLDLQMEERDSGLRILHALRRSPSTGVTPVILCSADILFLHEHENDIRALGADIIEKPLCFDTLLCKVRDALHPLQVKEVGA
jgi:two-component system, OmpR family, aerobic respiration control sensor histidine kinase ArcB